MVVLPLQIVAVALVEIVLNYAVAVFISFLRLPRLSAAFNNLRALLTCWQGEDTESLCMVL